MRLQHLPQLNDLPFLQDYYTRRRPFMNGNPQESSIDLSTLAAIREHEDHLDEQTWIDGCARLIWWRQ
jgi:hypothetical protein